MDNREQIASRRFKYRTGRQQSREIRREINRGTIELTSKRSREPQFNAQYLNGANRLDSGKSERAAICGRRCATRNLQRQNQTKGGEGERNVRRSRELGFTFLIRGARRKISEPPPNFSNICDFFPRTSRNDTICPQSAPLS